MGLSAPGATLLFSIKPSRLTALIPSSLIYACADIDVSFLSYIMVNGEW
jgi:hypothetical protein